MWPLFRRWLSPPMLFILIWLLSSAVAQSPGGTSPSRTRRLLAASGLPSRLAPPAVVSLDDLLAGIDLSGGPKSVEVHIKPGDSQRAAVVVSVKISDLFPEEDDRYYGTPSTGKKRLLSAHSPAALAVPVTVPPFAPTAAAVHGLASLSQRIAAAGRAAQGPTVLRYWLSTAQAAGTAAAWVETALLQHSTARTHSTVDASTSAAAAGGTGATEPVSRQLSAASGSSSVPGISTWLEGANRRDQEAYETLTGRGSSSSSSSSSSVRSSPVVRLTDIPVGGRKLLEGATQEDSQPAVTTRPAKSDTAKSASSTSKSPKGEEDQDTAAKKGSATQGTAVSGRGSNLSNYVAGSSAETRKELEAIGATTAASEERKKVTISDLGLPDK